MCSFLVKLVHLGTLHTSNLFENGLLLSLIQDCTSDHHGFAVFIETELFSLLLDATICC